MSGELASYCCDVEHCPVDPHDEESVTTVPWAATSPGVYEDMVACLLCHMSPETRRIDGSGGDGGRDCQFDTPAGLVAFELKSFSGRMTPGRRRQVGRSLSRAALLDPVRWELIVPIDPTPRELKWFKALAGTVSFSIEWRGRTWLDTRFAERPFIASYYLGDTRQEVIDLLRDLQKEEAGLAGGVPDAMTRVETLVRRANQLDPHYRVAIASDGKTTTVTIRPAYTGAEVDRPITIRAEFAFPTTTEEGRAKAAEFERSLDFGTPVDLAGDHVPQVTVDAPAGLGGTFMGPTVTLGPGRPVTDKPLDMVVKLLDPSGRDVAVLPIHLIPQSSGRKGSILRGTDRSGYVEADVEIDVGEGKYRVALRVNGTTFVPHDFAPAARFLAEFHAPNHVVVAESDRVAGSDPYSCPPEAILPEWVATLVTDLAIIQVNAGKVQEVSGDMTAQDAINAAGGVRLLRGMETGLPWTSAEAGLRASAPLEMRKQLAEGVIRFEKVVDEPVVIRVCGVLYPVGHRYHFLGLARVDPASIAALVADPLTEDIRIKLRPDAEASATVRLVE